MSGKFYEELEAGMTIRHAAGRTITEMDNTLFCAITLNTQPLHINADYARQTEFGRRIVNGILTLGLVIGLTVADLTEGTIVANLGYERVTHPKPVFHGDTIYAETEVIEKRDSSSRPNQGIVKLKHQGHNQHGEIVCEVERTVLFLKRGDVRDG